MRLWNSKIPQTFNLLICLSADFCDPNIILLRDMSRWWIYARFCYQTNIYGLMVNNVNVNIYPDGRVQTSVQLSVSPENYRWTIVLTVIVPVHIYTLQAKLHNCKYNSFPAILKFTEIMAVRTHCTETEIYK
jgi:hypothetical protein